MEVTNFWAHVASTSIGIIITMLGFWATFIRHMVTKKEVANIVENQSQYTKDRSLIMQRLEENKDMQEQFSKALWRNADVMNELKIQIATLGTTLTNLEERIDHLPKQ